MIACLGWGSLIWNPGILPVEGGSWYEDGPQLPIEFTRVSKGGRLTLVVTEGVPTLTVFWSRLLVDSIDEAITALSAREGCPRGAIGYWTGDRISQHAQAAVIEAWANDRGHEGVVWTALKPGFPDSRGKPLSCAQAIAHLRDLKGPQLDDAQAYVRQAPRSIRTPYRIKIEREFGWTPL